jgi:hypothetical protein
MKALQTVAIAVVLLNAWSTVARADQTNYDIGKVGASALTIGLGARPVAMGEAFVAKADDLNSTAWNPAGLSQVQGLQAGFLHDIYLENTSLEYLAYAQNVFENAGIGANVMLLNFGSMDKIDDNANTIGNFSPTIFAATVGYGQQLLPALSAGATVKFYNQNIDNVQSSVFAVDLGAIIKPGLDGLQFGVALQNLGSKVGDANLPLNAKAGAAYSLPLRLASNDTWEVLADVNVPFGDTTYVAGNIGTEYWFSRILALRVGYQIKNSGGLDGVNGLTAGVGTKLAMSDNFCLNVDYAMVTFGNLGLSHQIMLGMTTK